MPRRMGRPGLVGTMARTAVVAGTATVVAGSMAGHQQQKAANSQAAAAQQQQAMVDQAAAQAAAQLQAQQAAAPAAPAPAAAGPSDDALAQIQKLGDLKAQGLLTDEEFATAKAKLLGI